MPGQSGKIQPVLSRLLFLLLLGASVIIAACGGDGSPTATPDDASPQAGVTIEVLGTPTPQPAPEAAATSEPSRRVTLNAVGDLMLARRIVTLMDQNGALYPYEAVQHLLDDADLTIGNLEGTFTDGGVQANKFYTFRTPPRHAIGLAQAGFDVVSLGNNHAMDFGEEGLVDTLAALDEAGVRHSGAGLDAAAARQPAVLEANGLRIAFLSYNGAALSEAFPADEVTPGVALAEAEAIRADVAAALTEADLAIVSLHVGIEYVDEPNQDQIVLSRAAIDAGAALVLGHHPHVLQGWEQYGEGYIFYSLGNFVFDLDFEDLEVLGPRPFQTYVLHLELTADGVERFEMRPVFIDPAQNRPVPAEGERLNEVEARIELLNAQ